jgi:hypothetical protein
MSYNYGSESPLGVPFEEMEGSPTVQFVRGKGLSGTRILRCDWNNYAALARELLGVIAFVAGAPVSATPLSFPGIEFLIVKDIDIKPFQPNSPDGNHPVDILSACNTYANGALLTVEYGPMDLNNDPNRPDIPSGTFLSVSSDSNGEYQTIPGRVWKWSSTGATGPTIGEAIASDVPGPGVITPVRQHNFVWSYVTNPPDNTIINSIGRVNNAPFYGKDAQTLLFTNVRSHREFQFDNSNPLWTIEYGFGEHPFGWNKFLYTDAKFYSIASSKGGNSPYQTADFTQLFGYNG